MKSILRMYKYVNSIAIITIAPELRNALAVIHSLKQIGIVVSLGKSPNAKPSALLLTIMILINFSRTLNGQYRRGSGRGQTWSYVHNTLVQCNAPRNYTIDYP